MFPRSPYEGEETFAACTCTQNHRTGLIDFHMPAGSPSTDSFNPTWNLASIGDVVRHFRSPAYLVRDTAHGTLGATLDTSSLPAGCNVVGTLPALYPEWLAGRTR